MKIIFTEEIWKHFPTFLKWFTQKVNFTFLVEMDLTDLNKQLINYGLK